jgi:ABC-type multidrug transport system fused ATPase/permease subunit
MSLFDLIKRFRGGMFIVFVLVTVEHVAWIIEPTAFGNLLDALIAKEGSKYISETDILPLSIWVGLFLLNSGTGAIRRSIDQKIFLNMYVDIATDVSETANTQGQSVSKAAVRAQLSREYITFFQYRVPEIADQVITIVGAITALAVFDYRIALTCFVIVVPLLYMTKLYNEKVILLQSDVHNRFENVYEIYETKDTQHIRDYYINLSKPQQQIANWGALNFAAMRFFLLGIFLVVLYISIDLDNLTTGNIYAIVSYLWTFTTTTEYLPELMESWTSLKDISTRLKNESL